MSSRLDAFRNRTALRIEAKKAVDFEAKVKEQYEDIKSNVEDDGYRGYWLAIIMFIGPDSDKAVQANGYFEKSAVARSRHKLASLSSTIRYNQVLLTALDREGMIEKSSALYRFAHSDVDEALKRNHEDWNIAAAVQYIKELKPAAERALAKAIERRQASIDHMESQPALENLSREGLQEAYNLGFFGMGDGVKEEEQRSLDSYKDDGYEGLNKGLRLESEKRAGPLTFHQQRMAEQIDSAFKHFVTKKDLKVQRGIKFGSEKEFKAFVKAMAGMKPGTVIEDRGYVSTTMNNSTADSFASNSDTKVSVRLNIDVPKGSRALPIGAFLHARDARSEPDSECEILLPRKSRFEIVEYTKPKTTDDPQVAYVRLRLVPAEKVVNRAQAHLMEQAMAKQPTKPAKPAAPAKKGSTPKKNKFVYDAEDAMSLKVVKKAPPAGSKQ